MRYTTPTAFENIPYTNLATNFGTPLYVYSERVIKEQVSKLKNFGTIRYAQKALSNLSVLNLLKKENVVVDAVTAGEIYRALKVGYKGLEKSNSSNDSKGTSGIVYCSDILDEDAIPLIRDNNIPVNIGSLDMIEQLAVSIPKANIILRINPGFGHGHSKKANTGGENSKHGIWHEQLDTAVNLANTHGLRLIGLHMHIGSGTDFAHLAKVTHAMRDAAFKVGSELQIISAGGGLPIPYKSDSEQIDIKKFIKIWHDTKEEIEKVLGKLITLEVEPGRFLVAEAGILVTKIRAIKTQGSQTYYMLNAGFDTLVRPAMYGAYHEMHVVPANGLQLPNNTPKADVVVAGPLCESGDVFTQEEGGTVITRPLPIANVGDLLLIHHTGAYGMSMASRYNSRKLPAEVMITESGKIELIRERDTLEDLIKGEVIY
jgi:diaminopimelate decarboxylase